MIPDFLPFPGFIVYITGEIMFAIGLINPKTRRISFIILVLYFIAVLPVNIMKAMDKLEINGTFNLPVMKSLTIQTHFYRMALYCSKIKIQIN